MNHPFSQLEEAFRAMLVHKATGRDHDALSAALGLPRPRNFLESDWVNAVHVLGFGARGHPKAVFRFIEMALRRFEREGIERRSVQILDGQPARFYQGTGAVFDADYLGRLVRVGGVLYRTSQEHADDWTWIGLETGATSHFRAAEFEATSARTVRFLPFRVREATGGPQFDSEALTGLPDGPVGYNPGTGAVYEVLLYPSQFNTVPPTYLRVTLPVGASGVSSAVDPNNLPLGGHLCPNAAYVGHVAGAAFPLYLDNGRRMREFERVLDDVLAAGIKAEIKLDLGAW
jgi:hypothetical protein